MILQLALLVLGAYVLGATPFGFLMGKAKGIDIRDHGSGNIGATNVLRTVGKKEGIIVFVLDVLKGLVPVLLGKELAYKILEMEKWELLLAQATFEAPKFLWLPPWEWFSIISVLLALATILGHNHTFWLGFKGGKGVATSGGALIALLPWAVLISVIVWVAVFYSSRFVSLASICAALSVPISVIALGFFNGGHEWPLIALGIVVAALGVWRHRANISRLRAGTENRMTKKQKS